MQMENFKAYKREQVLFQKKKKTTLYTSLLILNKLI